MDILILWFWSSKFYHWYLYHTKYHVSAFDYTLLCKTLWFLSYEGPGKKQRRSGSNPFK